MAWRLVVSVAQAAAWVLYQVTCMYVTITGMLALDQLAVAACCVTTTGGPDVCEYPFPTSGMQCDTKDSRL